MRYVLGVAGLFLAFNGYFLLTVANMNLGHILTFLLGTCLILIFAFYKKITIITSKGLPRVLKYCIAILVCAQIALGLFIAFYGEIDNTTFTEDAVIVLGAGVHGERISLPLKFRLDKAVEYHKKNPDAIIVVSGGKGFQEEISEAEAMKKYLVNQSVNEKCIIMEENSTSTIENMAYSKEILDAHFDSDYSVVIITNNFHIYRGVSYAKGAGFKNVSHMSAHIRWYTVVPNYLRETLAVLKMWVFD